MKVWVRCVRGVQVAYVTLHHRGCTLVPPSTWAKRVPRVVTAIGHDKRALHTAVHLHDLQAQHDAQKIAARLDTTRRQLRDWHIRRAKELAQEQQRYFQNPKP